jgi:hypothetical protein
MAAKYVSSPPGRGFRNIVPIGVKPPTRLVNLSQHLKAPFAQSVEELMLRLVATVGFVHAIVVGSVVGSRVGNAEPLLTGSVKSTYQAPIGHLQPRAAQSVPSSAAEHIEQEKMSTFNAEQKKLDEQLDKSLNICRCR